MRFREVKSRPVVDLTTATRVGTVTGLAVDAGVRRVVGLRMGRRGKDGSLAWEDLAAFGADAVTFDGGDRGPLAETGEGWVDEGDLLGRRILSEQGNELGSVVDVEFDPATGRVEQVVGTAGPIPAPAVLGVGTYALVVDESVEPGPPTG